MKKVKVVAGGEYDILHDAAIRLVATGGWDQLTMRRLATEVGARSPSSISERYRMNELSLRLELVDLAFAEILIAVRNLHESPSLSPGELRHILAVYLRTEPHAASLMVQVTAQAQLSGSEKKDQVARRFSKTRERTIALVAKNLQAAFSHPEPGLLIRAERAVDWYIAASAVVHVCPSADLGILI